MVDIKYTVQKTGEWEEIKNNLVFNRHNSIKIQRKKATAYDTVCINNISKQKQALWLNHKNKIQEISHIVHSKYRKQTSTTPTEEQSFLNWASFVEDDKFSMETDCVLGMSLSFN